MLKREGSVKCCRTMSLAVGMISWVWWMSSFLHDSYNNIKCVSGLGLGFIVLFNTNLPDNIEGPGKWSKTQYYGEGFPINQIFPVKGSRDVSKAQDQSR